MEVPLADGGARLPAPRAGQPPRPAEDPVVAALLAGDEALFARLVTSWSAAMLRLARAHVSTDASAQEVVQETWLAVLRGLPGFEGRSTLRTWVFRILVHTATARGVRESRVTPVGDLTDEPGGATVDPARFRGPGDRWHRHWTPAGQPRPWDGDPAQGALRAEVRALLEAALDALPPRQRTVVVMRDVEGFTAAEVREVLGLTAANQRVLLHRGRARVRAALEVYHRGHRDDEPRGDV
ncbi:RNA polymerase sigma factor [Geodermatophilus sp. DSM 44513]|uniref:RNA polymerase sigma factor n=1 Tax=Geodermatophilus sp. DSM 44513 TaxID=1528104 RepID=UPI001280911B|nr:sigma-70 family RNA polymerase sigma factor [Geodermatophilus sp. DSM 44513]WNV73957.1 sigma-70 family RNA polymerase sigma factor [Geodermatophilus sp. DSM 44513]